MIPPLYNQQDVRRYIVIQLNKKDLPPISRQSIMNYGKDIIQNTNRINGVRNIRANYLLQYACDGLPYARAIKNLKYK